MYLLRSLIIVLLDWPLEACFRRPTLLPRFYPLSASNVSSPDCLAVQWPKQIAEDVKDLEDSECRAL